MAARGWTSLFALQLCLLALQAHAFTAPAAFPACLIGSSAARSAAPIGARRAGLGGVGYETHGVSRRAPRVPALSMNLFDGLVSKIADATREVTVQHILVEKEQEAVELRKKLAKEKNLAQKFGEYAAQHSTCGSAKKTPDAKLAQLRGEPGEMKFRRGQTDKNFEKAAFETAQLGKVAGPIKTKFGYHLMLVRDRPEAGGSDAK